MVFYGRVLSARGLDHGERQSDGGTHLSHIAHPILFAAQLKISA